MADSTKSSIHIAAAPGEVLDVIADLAAYPEWTGGMKQVTVLAEDDLGWADQAEFTVDQGPISDTYVLEYTWDVEEDGQGVVSWTLVKASILRSLDGAYTLTSDGGGGTQVTYQLNAELKMPMPGMLRRKAEKTIVDTALTELKKRVEG